MKFPNFKKYFFSYVTIFFSFLFYYIEYKFINTEFPVVEDDSFFQPEGMYFFLVAISCIASLFSILLLGLEILVRKYIIEKYFPNLKITLKFKIPEIVSRVYSFIFAVLFILATLPILFIGIYLLVMYIIEIF